MTRAALTVTIAVALLALVDADQQPLFKANVDVARIDVSVMNGIVPVAGLVADNFVITDNGVPQTIDSVSLDAVPLDLMMVIDTSGSLEGERLTALIEAANGLVKSLKPEDRVGVITFSEPVRLAVESTRLREPLVKALTGLVADGSTSVNDAVFLALQLRPPDSDATRPVVLLFSDGRDTSSWLRSDHVIEATKRSGVVLHVVELVADQWLGARGVEVRPSSFLGQLADIGGGRRWFAKSPRDLRELFGKALNELRARYLLTYSPTGVSREGWHDVKVTLKNARGEVTARPGYYAGQ